MLVLSRKIGEKILIGDNIVLTIVKIDRNQIRLGIEAPHDVPVFREESHRRESRPKKLLKLVRFKNPDRLKSASASGAS